MTAKKYTIGHLSRETGTKIPTIRYYEQIGLLPHPDRSPANTRLYSAEHKARLAFIQHCRELGFKQSAIRELLELSDHSDQSCNAVTDIARTHLDEINRRILRLTALKSELVRMVTTCTGGRVEQCHIIHILADHSHSHCLTDDHEGLLER